MMCFSCRVTSDAKSSVFGCNTNASGYYIRFFLYLSPINYQIRIHGKHIKKNGYQDIFSWRRGFGDYRYRGGSRREKKKTDVKEPLKGNVRHSVSKWCFGDYKLDEFCEICKHIGIESVELLDPVDWPIVQKHGLTVAMAQGAGLGIDRGFNDPALHDELVASYEKVIPMVADAGLTNLICFSGRRNGVTDLQGWENCEKGLKRLIPLAEKHKVVLTMELLKQCRP